MDPPPPARAALSTLPPALLLRIRAHIPLARPADHTSLAATCRALRALYADEPFWAALAFACGYGRPAPHPVDHPARAAPWRTLAYCTLNHARSCRFTQNPWRGAMLVDQVFSPEVYDRVGLAPSGFFTFMELFLGGVADQGDLAEHRVFAEGHGGAPPAEDAFLAHAWAACAFATNPPLPRVEINVLDFTVVSVKNPGGVTVYDVIYELGEHLAEQWQSFSLNDLAWVYKAHRDRIPALKQLDWLCRATFADVADHMRRLRSAGEVPESAWAKFKWWNANFPRSIQRLPLLYVFAELDNMNIESILDYMEGIPSLAKSAVYIGLDDCRSLASLLSSQIFFGISNAGKGSAATFIANWDFSDCSCEHECECETKAPKTRQEASGDTERTSPDDTEEIEQELGVLNVN